MVLYSPTYNVFTQHVFAEWVWISSVPSTGNRFPIKPKKKTHSGSQNNECKIKANVSTNLTYFKVDFR